MKIEFTTDAWTSSVYHATHFTNGLEKGNNTLAGNALTFTNSDMSGQGEWTKVETARITVELLSAENVKSRQLEALKIRLQNVRAENQQRENAILDAISKLTAIEYVGEA